jgi:hypothetical protein
MLQALDDQVSIQYNRTKGENMTWRELKNLINKKAREDKSFLDNAINIYNFEDGEEYEVDITELSCSDEEISEDSQTNWVTYLSINHEKEEGIENETETKETSID